jgi:DUF1016 N-terminal domain
MPAKRAKNRRAIAPVRRTGAATANLLTDLRTLIYSTRTGVAQVVNSAQVLLYWKVGHRIRTEILGEKRAGYGERIVATVAEYLTTNYGRRCSDKNIRHVIRFAEVFADFEIVSALSRQLGWTHFTGSFVGWWPWI